MIRVLLFFGILIALAFGEAWLVDRPGELVLNWQGYRIETSVLVAIGAVIVAAAALLALWSLIRFVFKIPVLDGHRDARPAARKGLRRAVAGDDRGWRRRCATRPQIRCRGA